MISKIGGRKALAFVTAVIIVVGVYLVKGELSETFANTILALVGTYIAGNVGADLADAAKLKAESVIPSSTAPDNNQLDAVKADIQAVKEIMAQSAETQQVLTQAVTQVQQAVAYLVQKVPAPQQQAAQGTPPMTSSFRGNNPPF